MGYHIYAIGKAIRALFADRVTYNCTSTDKIFKVRTSTSSILLPVVKKKNIGLKSPKAGHRLALGYTNTKRNEI